MYAPVQGGSGPGTRWLGLDEAGRGSVLGPLVVGGFLVPEAARPALAAAGARDSKELTPAGRAAAYARLRRLGTPFRLALPPRRIDAAVRRGALNRLEAEAFAVIIRRARPDRVIVDACDPVAARFGRLLSALSGGRIPIEARHHADRDEPLVGAASIVAKLHRDAEIRRLALRLGSPVGSGYPSDPVTIDYLKGALAAPEPAPWIRHSWATAQRLKRPLPVQPLERFAP